MLNLQAILATLSSLGLVVIGVGNLPYEGGLEELGKSYARVTKDISNFNKEWDFLPLPQDEKYKTQWEWNFNQVYLKIKSEINIDIFKNLQSGFGVSNTRKNNNFLNLRCDAYIKYLSLSQDSTLEASQIKKNYFLLSALCGQNPVSPLDEEQKENYYTTLNLLDPSEDEKKWEENWTKGKVLLYGSRQQFISITGLKGAFWKPEYEWKEQTNYLNGRCGAWYLKQDLKSESDSPDNSIEILCSQIHNPEKDMDWLLKGADEGRFKIAKQQGIFEDGFQDLTDEELNNLLKDYLEEESQLSFEIDEKVEIKYKTKIDLITTKQITLELDVLSPVFPSNTKLDNPPYKEFLLDDLESFPEEKTTTPLAFVDFSVNWDEILEDTLFNKGTTHINLEIKDEKIVPTEVHEKLISVLEESKVMNDSSQQLNEKTPEIKTPKLKKENDLEKEEDEACRWWNPMCGLDLRRMYY